MAKTHGDSKSPLYAVWCTMKARCNQPNSTKYNIYGGRGIRVCDQWVNSYEAFKNWAINNGYKHGLTIDRIDVNGNYSPDNCRWTTPKEQARNTRTNHYVEYDGEVFTLIELSEKYNINYDLLKVRINKLHWPIEKSLFTPPEKYDLITYDGVSLPLKAWARKLNINPDTLRWRIKRCGWSIERAFTTPVRGSANGG